MKCFRCGKAVRKPIYWNGKNGHYQGHCKPCFKFRFGPITKPKTKRTPTNPEIIDFLEKVKAGDTDAESLIDNAAELLRQYRREE